MTSGAPTVWWENLASPEFLLPPVVLDADSGATVGLVPVGATEQHGPHLPTGTDTIVASGICARASARTGAPVLPPVSVGASYGHGTELPGTLSLSPQLLTETLLAYARWATHSGIDRLLYVNAHAGNQAAVAMALDCIRFEHPQLRAGAVHWWQSDARLREELLADGDDIHANRGETAILMALAPELVQEGLLDDADDPDRTEPLVFAYTAASLSVNGVTGRPSEATPKLGEQLLGWAVDALVATIERGRLEEPPLSKHALESLGDGEGAG